MSEFFSPYHHPVTPERGFIFQCNTQTGHTNASYFHCNLSLPFFEWLREMDGSLGLRKKQSYSCQKWLELRNNGTPCVILTAPQTPDVLLALILCSLYLWDHGCLLQLVLSFLAQEHRDNQHGCAACQKEREERKRGKRNVLIARRIQTVWENLFEKCAGNKTKANQKVTVWSSCLKCALLPRSTCSADTLHWAWTTLGQ